MNVLNSIPSLHLLQIRAQEISRLSFLDNPSSWTKAGRAECDGTGWVVTVLCLSLYLPQPLSDFTSSWAFLAPQRQLPSCLFLAQQRQKSTSVTFSNNRSFGHLLHDDGTLSISSYPQRIGRLEARKQGNKRRDDGSMIFGQQQQQSFSFPLCCCTRMVGILQKPQHNLMCACEMRMAGRQRQLSSGSSEQCFILTCESFFAQIYGKS